MHINIVGTYISSDALFLSVSISALCFFSSSSRCSESLSAASAAHRVDTSSRRASRAEESRSSASRDCA